MKKYLKCFMCRSADAKYACLLEGDDGTGDYPLCGECSDRIEKMIEGRKTMKYERLQEIVLMAYHIGKNDGSREQVDKLLREVEL